MFKVEYDLMNDQDILTCWGYPVPDWGIELLMTLGILKDIEPCE